MACPPGRHRSIKTISRTDVGLGYYDVEQRCETCGVAWVITTREAE